MSFIIEAKKELDKTKSEVKALKREIKIKEDYMASLCSILGKPNKDPVKLRATDEILNLLDEQPNKAFTIKEIKRSINADIKYIHQLVCHLSKRQKVKRVSRGHYQSTKGV